MRGLRQFLIVLALVGIAVGVVGWLFGPSPELTGLGATTITGTAHAIDGDSITIKGHEIRLFGIDAPEGRQNCLSVAGKTLSCGRQAHSALARRLAGRTVTCAQVELDRYGRMIARCKTGNTDINRWMVAQGHALAYRRYSNDYTDAEAEARAGKRGIWRTIFKRPWVWRAQNRKPR
jgi:endonuclease YncB( thermonuclease family)